MNRKISICLTNYNRNAYLFQSFEQVYNDERIGEIVIVDDCSDMAVFNEVAERCKYIQKVKLYRNENNKGVYDNKREAISKATNEYCIIFDSDNVIDTAYIDKVFSLTWKPELIFAPSFAKPLFDYRRYTGIVFSKQNVANYCGGHFFNAMMNTMNYFVNRDKYLSAWQPKPGINGADSIYMNYLWLLAGNEIEPIAGLEYLHRVEHDGKQSGSNYIIQASISNPDAVENLMRGMR